MADFKDKFLDKENFYIAFKKLKGFFQQYNEWFNPLEFSSYEANLATNIYNLINQLKEEKYTPKPIQPLPFPKKNNKDNEQRLRQYFRISLDDQLIWIAITNVIGLSLEKQMPFWSYGNRLYRQVWFEEENGQMKLRKGNYTNSSEHYYRKWNQSWPFFRRHISMTIKTMAYNKSFKIEYFDDEIEKTLYTQEENNRWSDYPYLDPGFWKVNSIENLYWAGLDYTKFFQSIKPDIVVKTVEKYLLREDGTKRDDCSLLISLVERMLKFPLETSGWENPNDLKDLNKAGLENVKNFEGIPTGLIAAGFLANIAMIDLDRKVDKYVDKHRDIAVFKYVDDQVVLCSSKKELLDFLNFYDKELKASGLGVTFQKDKLQPEKCFKHTINGFEYEDDESNEIDINYPEPLMTHTLQKMSNLNDQEYELSDESELEKSEADLAHFLLADFPDSEMRRDTRMAFASMKLCQLAKQIRPDFRKLDRNLQHNRDAISSKFKRTGSQIKIEKFEDQEYKRIFDTEILKVKRKHEKIFDLLLKAAFENPDKLKLWKRCVEFCYNSGIQGLEKVYSKINNLDFDPKGKIYLQNYTLLNINYYLIRAYNSKHSEGLSFWDNYTALNFIKASNSANIRIGKNKFPFTLETTRNYKVYRALCKTDNLYKYFLQNRIGNGSLMFENYLWDILSKTNEKNKSTLFDKNAEYISIKNSVAWNIFLLYPERITLKQFDEIQAHLANRKNQILLESWEFKNDGEGILYQIFNANTAIKTKYRKQFPIIVRSLEKQDTDYIILQDWLEETKRITSKKTYIDPRLSEWSFLQIIIQISDAIYKSRRKRTIFDISNFELDKIHPANYWLPKTWISSEKITWESWRKLLQDPNKKIRIREQNELISDFRFLPLSKQWKTHGYSWFFGGEEFSIIVGLSVLLTQLLAKSFTWPSTANKNTFIDQVYSRAKLTVETQPISSDTRLLLNLVFSKRHIDFFSMERKFIGEDGYVIKNLKDFSKKLREIQKKLEETHLTLVDHAPRQLTIIDVDKLNNAATIV